MSRITFWMIWAVPFALMLIGMRVTLAFEVPLAGDPIVYLERVLAIQAGGIPYVDPVFEHLPVTLAPMYLAYWLAGADPVPYTVVFGGLMSLALSLTGVLFMRQPAPSDGLLARRWLWLAAPLMPFVTFRADPVVVLLATAAFLPIAARSRPLLGLLAVLAKGWPIAMIPSFWAMGRRKAGAVMTAAGVIAVGLVLSPGFQSTQRSGPLHIETLVGSLVGVTRAAEGRDLGLIHTTAVYIDAAGWMRLIGPLLAGLLVLIGVVCVRNGPSLRNQALATAVLVVGVIMASPLFSPQYVLWIIPFLVFAETRLTRYLMTFVSMQCLVSVFALNGVLEGNLWLLASNAVRNVALLMIAGLLAREALTGSSHGAPAGADRRAFSQIRS